MRLDKLLGNMGVGTRKEVKLLVRWGRVLVNGERAWNSSEYVDTDKDEVMVDGEIITYKAQVYLMMNKPQGYVSATEDSRDHTVIELVPEQFCHYELFPVGRLDKDTEGLLILTNDGKLAHDVLTPKKHVPKIYRATIEGIATQKIVEAFKMGVALDDGYKTMPAALTILSVNEENQTSEIELMIHEGKFHQVKRMFESVEMKVVYLKRVRMGKLELDPTLELGKLRELTEDEIEQMKWTGKEE